MAQFESLPVLRAAAIKALGDRARSNMDRYAGRVYRPDGGEAYGYDFWHEYKVMARECEHGIEILEAEEPSSAVNPGEYIDRIWLAFHDENLREAIPVFEELCLEGEVKRVGSIADLEQLLTIAKSKGPTYLHAVAIDKIKDSNLLIEIIKEAQHTNARDYAFSKLRPDELERLARNDNDLITRRGAITRICNQQFLKELFVTECDSEIRIMILDRITDEEFLAETAAKDTHRELCVAAIKRLNRRDLLIRIASQADAELAAIAVDQSGPGALHRIAVQAPDVNVRRMAWDRLSPVRKMWLSLSLTLSGIVKHFGALSVVVRRKAPAPLNSNSRLREDAEPTSPRARDTEG